MPVKITNTHNVPQELFKAMNRDDHVNKGDISVTTLIDAPQIKILKDNNEYEQDVMDMLFMQLGTAFHTVMEQNTYTHYAYHGIKQTCRDLVKMGRKDLALEIAKEAKKQFKDEEVGKDIFVERTLTLDVTVTSSVTGKVHVIKLSGTQDYYQKSLKLLRDYKVTGVSQYNSDQKHWIHQQNIYAYMLRQIGEEVETIEILAFFRNWSKMKAKWAKKSENYPKQPSVVIPLEVWSDEKCLKYIEDRVRLHVEALEVDKVPLCTASERWAGDDTFIVNHDDGSKNFYNYALAKKHIEEEPLVNPRINYKLASSLKCNEYCPVSKFCDQHKKRMELIKKNK